MNPLIIYLIAINLITFVLFTIDFFIMAKNDYNSDTGLMDGRLLSLFAVAGGGVGMLIALFVWTKCRINKHNVAWWFTSILCIIIWALICAWRWRLVQLDFGLLLGQFDMLKLKVLGIYLAIINIVTFIIFCYDKTMAEHGRRRIREFVLIGISLLGGSLGGILAIRLRRHKINDWYFVWGLPFFIFVHIALLVYAHAAGSI